MYKNISLYFSVYIYIYIYTYIYIYIYTYISICLVSKAEVHYLLFCHHTTHLL